MLKTQNISRQHEMWRLQSSGTSISSAVSHLKFC